MAVFVTPTVELVGATWFKTPSEVPRHSDDPFADSGEDLAVFAGRTCYQSWHRPNPETATTAGYLRNIILQKHWSVLEHAVASFYVTGVARSLTHELVRHRHLSPSQLSQRFVDDTDLKFVVPPLYEGDADAIEDLDAHAEMAMRRYRTHVDRHLRRGATRKQAREAARAFLPEFTETKITITGNYRSWMEFLIKRDSPAADQEIQRLARMIGAELAILSPNVFGPAARGLWQSAGFIPTRQARINAMLSALSEQLAGLSNATVVGETLMIAGDDRSEQVDLRTLADHLVSDLETAWFADAAKSAA
ncbi:FAD-dependent thymidylate synthase [Nocardia asteroides]|uniref:FAD-dependent thymidylate synthase n=1 Tax=Nocardia asteroides TaxID=1824 RepID=UPI0037C78773